MEGKKSDGDAFKGDDCTDSIYLPPLKKKSNLKHLNYNSCDDVRQAIKAALNAQTKELLIMDQKNNHEESPKNEILTAKNAPKLDIAQRKSPVEEEGNPNTSRKRRRPNAPRANKRKPSRKQIFAKLYLGKLSNLVNYRSQDTDSESSEVFSKPKRKKF